jgi:hypothetical protein
MFSLILSIVELAFYTIGNGDPVLGARDSQLHLCFHIRLIEAGKDSETMKNFKLRIDVLIAVGSVSKRMKAHGVSIVRIKITQSYSIPA